MASASPCPTPTHMVAVPLRPPVFQMMQRRQHQPRAAHAQRVAEGNRPAVGIDLRCIVGQTQFAQDRKPPAGKRFIELNDIEIGHRRAQTLDQLTHRWHRTNAHHPRCNRRTGHAEHAGTRCQAMLFHCFGRRQNQRSSTVVDPGRVTGSHRAVRAVDRLEFAQGFQTGIATRMLILVDKGLALLCATRTGTISSSKKPAARATAVRCWLRRAKAS